MEDGDKGVVLEDDDVVLESILSVDPQVLDVSASFASTSSTIQEERRRLHLSHLASSKKTDRQQPMGGSITRARSRSSNSTIEDGSKPVIQKSPSFDRLHRSDGNLVHDGAKIDKSMYASSGTRRTPKKPPKQDLGEWRKQVELFKARLKKRTVQDAVPWHARDAKLIFSGKLVASEQKPRAPMPEFPERMPMETIAAKEDIIKVEKPKKKLVLPRKHSSTQTSLEKPVLQYDSTDEDEDEEDEVNMGLTEEECIRTIRHSRFRDFALKVESPLKSAAPFSQKWWTEELLAEDRRIQATFHAIRGTVLTRINTAKFISIEYREKLRAAIMELRLQLLIYTRKRELRNRGKENRAVNAPQEKETPVFLPGGSSVSTSWNKNAWKQHRNEKAKQKLPTGNGKARNTWNGSMFKIKMLNTLVLKLRMKLVLHGFRTNANINIIRRKFALERAEMIRKNNIRKVWVTWKSFYDSFAWLRERARIKSKLRVRELVSKVFTPWHNLALEGLVKRGKVLIADRFLHRKRIWKAFVAWRAQSCILQRYHALNQLYSTKWRNHAYLVRCFWGWYRVYRQKKVIRLRIRLWRSFVMQDESTRSIHRFTLDMGLTVPTWLWVKDRIHTHRRRLKQSLKASMENTMGEVTKSAVDTTCFVLMSDLENETDIGLPKWRKVIERRKRSYQLYLRIGRDPSDLDRISPFFGRVGMGRLVAKPLRSHIRALEHFVEGNGLRYTTLDNIVENKQTENDENERQPLPKKIVLNETSLGEYDIAPSAVFRLKTVMTIFRKWKIHSKTERSTRIAESFYRDILLRKMWDHWDRLLEWAWKADMIAERVGKRNLLRWNFRKWRHYTEKWKLVARKGCFSHWGRWKHHTRSRLQLRRKIERFRTVQILQRTWNKWKLNHHNRALLSRVFWYRELIWEEKYGLPSADPYTKQFHLLAYIVNGWKAYVQENKERERELASQIFYENVLLSKTFNEWKRNHRHILQMTRSTFDDPPSWIDPQ